MKLMPGSSFTLENKEEKEQVPVFSIQHSGYIQLRKPVFGNFWDVNDHLIVFDIIETLVYRMWGNPIKIEKFILCKCITCLWGYSVSPDMQWVPQKCRIELYLFHMCH